MQKKEREEKKIKGLVLKKKRGGKKTWKERKGKVRQKKRIKQNVIEKLKKKRETEKKNIQSLQ